MRHPISFYRVDRQAGVTRCRRTTWLPPWKQTVDRCCCALLACLGVATPLFAADEPSKRERPNIVLIMTDNHGAWTLGCYGNPDIRTPHIDQLAREGTMFSRAFSSNPVCSPTRATFLTGLLPSQHGVHCFLRGGRLQVGPEARNTLAEFTSIPEILREDGYACGLVGKWHLGDNLHPQDGLDDYWITMPHGGTSTFYDAKVIEDGEIRTEPEYLTDFWTRHAVDFIDQQSQADRPFFLFLSYNGPYALSRLLLRDGRNRHADDYAQQELPSFPREPSHPWQYANRDYANNPTSIRRVATEVSGIDDGVGTVMESLQRNGIDKDTLVIFVADQGWEGGHGGFFGMGDHTRPVTARDRMMQIPMIWHQPSRIAAGHVSNRLVTNYDLMPTLLNHLGLSEKHPGQPKLPGKDFSDEWQTEGRNTSSPRERDDQIATERAADEVDPTDEAVFYEFESLRSVRTDRWKYVHRHPNGPHELYDLQNDPEEFTNLVDEPQHTSQRAVLRQRIERFYEEFAEPKYDLWRDGGAQTQLFVGIDEETAQLAETPPPPLPADFQTPEITVPDGFSVELVAGPPLVQHPTMACFDDRGRLFVCESAGLNLSADELEAQTPNSIRMLEDRDQDGRFDHSTVFADNMTFPMGAAWHEGALYVASPPNIWRLEDTDGDGVADRREILVDRFGFTGNAASIHGCFLAPDGRLYWCDGYHGHEFRDDAGEITSKREGSYIFSCRPDGSDVQIHAGGGMDNPVEVDFTEAGDVLGTVNILYTRPRVDAMVHWLYGGAYPHRRQVLEELKVTGELLGPVHRFGHVGVSGMTRYRSGAINHRWQDNLFTTFFNTGEVVRLELTPQGSTYQATQRSFLSSSNRDFHPTDVLEDADGSLLVVDTGGWFYRGCPTSQFSKPEVLGGIYRVRRDGMTPLNDPWGRDIAWAQLNDRQCVGMTNDTRFQVRQRAIAELARRGAEMIPMLRQTVQQRDVRSRLAAIWALSRIAQNHATENDESEEAVRSAALASLRLAMDDREPTIRQAACHCLAMHRDADAVSVLIDALQDQQPAVRRVAAQALGRIGDANAVPDLLKGFEQASDRSEEHALTYALIEIDDADATAQALDSLDPHNLADRAATVEGALNALDQMDHGRLEGATVTSLLDAEPASLRATALRILRRHPEWSELAADTLNELLQSSDGTSDRSDVIDGLIVTLIDQPSVTERLGRILADAEFDSGRTRLVLQAIGKSRLSELPAVWSEPLQRMLQANDPETIMLAIDAVSAISTDRFDEQLQALGHDETLSKQLRVAAYEAMSGRGNRLSDELFELLLEMLGPSGTPAEAARASRAIAAASLTNDQLQALLPLLQQAGPMQLADLMTPFSRTRDLETGSRFLMVIEQARGFAALTPTAFSETIKRFPKELLPHANRLLDRLEADREEKIAKLDALLPLVEQADLQRGEKLFFSEKAKCSSCHRVGERGGTIGPDLTTIGANRATIALLESTVFPSASMVRDYEPCKVLTVDGRVLTGIIVDQTAAAVTLQQQTGEPQQIARVEIEAIEPSTVSLMPSGLEDALDEQELADVIAYLSGLR